MGTHWKICMFGGLWPFSVYPEEALGVTGASCNSNSLGLWGQLNYTNLTKGLTLIQIVNGS